MNTYIHTHRLIDEKTIFWGLSGIVFFSAIFYIYCITTTIHNVVARENIEIQASELALSIGQKEFDLIGLKNNITLVRAQNLGFSEVQDKTFITRQSVGFVSRASSDL